MRNLFLKAFVSLCVLASAAMAQVGNGTITGTITDPAGAVVAGATVEATNTGTGVAYTGVSTNAGDYTITNLPVGSYSVSAKVTGFKNYVHTNLAVAAAGTLRENIGLQVGNATTETVTVTAEASLLKTESADLTHNVSIDQLDDLPLLGIGTANSGTTGVRNPYNSLQTLPGVSQYASSGQFALNGLGGNMTETMRIDGLDATSRLFGTYDYTQMAQPSADSIQEIAYQTSNYSAEFGQAGSVVINMTMKSGTNRYHGTGFEYFVNEDLNAGNPFSENTITGTGPSAVFGGGKVRPKNRRNDFGGTFGGPVWIPKIYNGRNKTFFFFNYEEFLEKTSYQFTDTVPNAAFLKGDFSAISPNGTCSACGALGIPTGSITTDPAGHAVFANEIFNPTTRLANGTATPFPNNQIPSSLFSPLSQKFIALFPTATNNNFAGNLSTSIAGGRYSAIPSIKVDHNLSDKDKLSFYYSRINTESQISSPLGNADGLPLEIGGYRGTFIPNYTIRLNYDRTIKPNLLLHLGAGYFHTRFNDNAPFLKFDPTAFGLSNFLIHRNFPSVTGLSNATLGGMQNFGTSGQIQTLNFEEKPSYTASATYVRGAHTYKLGAELYYQENINGSFAGVTLATGTGPTSAPFTPTNSLNGQSMGFGFASFLLGDYSSTAQTPQLNYKQGQAEWAIYLQDSWKVSRKLTLDYGLRWDYASQNKEQYGRLGEFSGSVPNANAGGILGGTVFASTCNCSYYPKTYPYAIGPRVGVAYQITPKTVLRGGFGINYQFVGGTAGGTVTTNGAYPLSGINAFVNDQTPGFIVQPAWPVTNPSRFPSLSVCGLPSATCIGPVPGAGATNGGAPTVVDQNQLRPPRIMQYSIGLQREVTPSLLVEGAFVGNIGVWEQGATFATSGPLAFLSQISPAKFAKYGLYPYPGTGPAGYNYSIPGNSCTPGNDCDRALLSLPLNNPNVIAKMAAAGVPGGNISPYVGFGGTTLLSALYPYPQFGNISPTGSATGNSKYASMQLKVTKRLSHGLQAQGAYTWAKGVVRQIPEDIFNASGNQWTLQQIPPQALTFNVTYTLPKYGRLNKWANEVVSDWQVGFFAQYQSGIFLTPPVSNVNAEYLASEDIRVPGQSLYNVNINDIHSYNPYYDVVLNPKAWAPCPVNTTCGGAYNGAFGATAERLYADFRGPRQPRENANIGRHFRIKEKYDFYIRAEFVNIFNRTILPNPLTTNPQTAVSRNGFGILTNGFGVVSLSAITPQGVFQGAGTVPAPTAGATALLGRTGTIIARFQF
jgi:hypothetical protein